MNARERGGLITRVVEGMRYIATGNGPEAWFGPADAPAPQAPPEVAGRQFDYPYGANLRLTPRQDDGISFGALRGLADAYDLLRLVIETRKDQIEAQDWQIRPRPGSGAAPDDPRIAELTRFFRCPDREHDWGGWLRMLLEDLFVLDAPALYVRRTLAGAIHALEPLDGGTIKRVIDVYGRTPLPPEPAYQQILKGLPAVDYARDQLIYRPRNPRTHRLYGYGPVEQVVMTVNIALRRQASQLQYYTEGNVPEAIIGVPDSWSPDQIGQFQAYWDSLLEGDMAARRHAKFVPGGISWTATREPELKGEFDEWLARVICFAFSIPPTSFIRQPNRSTAETAQQTALEEGLGPLLSWVKGLIDHALCLGWGIEDLEFVWAEGRGPDPLKQAQVTQIYVGAGIKTVAEARAELGLPELKPQESE